MGEDNAPAVAVEDDRTSQDVVAAARSTMERQAKSIHWWLTGIFTVGAAGFCAAVYLSTLAPRTALEQAVSEMNAKLDRQGDRFDRDEKRLGQVELDMASERAAHRRIDKSLRWQMRATYEMMPQRTRDRVLPPPPSDDD